MISVTMRSFSTRIALSLLLASASTAVAQPDTRDHRQHRPPPPAAVDTGPTSAPPAPLNEAVTPKAGYTWISGRWDWKNGKWAWTAGHWERERVGKKWRQGRWDQHDNKWSWVDGEWVNADAQPPAPPQPPPPVVGPTEAPPAPREEKWQPRKGFVFVAGNWDWKNGKWEWVAGHWEREQAGKKWRTSRWEQRDGKWSRIDGGWEDEHAGPPQPPPPPSHGPGRHDWKLERPVVSSYWPAKGKAGTRITIKGKNFPTSAQVIFAGQPVKAAKVTADKIVFTLPANATSGAITLQADARRQLPVGQFEVVASYDPVAEQRRIDEERQKAAEAAWKARQSQLAKDRAAREAAMRQAMEERAATRERRRAEMVAALQAKFQRDFLADDDTQDELTLHAQRIAELTRARDVAEVSANGKLVVRIDVAMGRENQRHDERMAALEAGFKARGGQR
jgi:hypothetical protein